MNVFNVDFDKLNFELLPTFLRKPLLLAFLQAATALIKRIWNAFLFRQEDIFFLLKYNPSKRNVEIALRRRFDDNGIYIENTKPQKGLYLGFHLPAYIKKSGFKIKTETAYLPKYLPFYLEKPAVTSDFTIYVPELTYRTSSRAIYDFASFFVLPGFKYDVQRI